MNERVDRAELALNELADGTRPPADILDLDALLRIAASLLDERRGLIEAIEELGENERALFRARPGVATKLAAYLAITNDWARAITRGRDAVAARVAAVRSQRRRRG